MGFDMRNQKRKKTNYQQLPMKFSLLTVIEHSKESLAREKIFNDSNSQTGFGSLWAIISETVLRVIRIPR